MLLWACLAQALTPLGSIRYSPDITVVLGGTTLNHNQVAEDNLAGGVTLVNVGAIPSTAIITAYDRLPNGDQLLAFDTTVTLPGGLTVRPGDVVRFNGTTYTLEFDAAANGIPAGAITDAVGEIGPGDLLLSFDVTVTVGGITATDEDLVRVHGGVFSLFFDGSAAGIDPGLDLDAAYILASNGHLLLAFDGSGTVGGVTFTSEDVLEFTPTSTGWALAYDGLAEHSGWVGADLHGLSAVTNPPSTPVPPGFEPDSGGGAAGSGVFPGSKRVFGMGTPNAVPDNSCIAIYAVGPNGVPDHPPGSIDDQLLGTGVSMPAAFSSTKWATRASPWRPRCVRASAFSRSMSARAWWARSQPSQPPRRRQPRLSVWRSWSRCLHSSDCGHGVRSRSLIKS